MPDNLMYEHEFHAIDAKGHKRNFTWWDKSGDELKTIKSTCHLCDYRTVEFTIKKYWEKIKLLPQKT